MDDTNEDARRGRIRWLLERLLERTLLVSCGDDGPVVRGGEPGVRDEPGLQAFVRELQEIYVTDPTSVRDILRPDSTEQRFGSIRRGGPVPGRG
jgi:hypothetical protein